ncbi:FG-GAP repeat domain-containing protein [Nannocystis bainbridge]|uniref:VCBS repeat-containing protein n=1 Tax=Nannocystis bainbridge TaxID=2995303 RepID=A0ABT5E9Q8_9BACT|nr:VCBS repeat-containing protein [Nannocystis bainbridge]MDC0722173.1 VCBS repeat-containing protein [Nannocystis bainbridge]
MLRRAGLFAPLAIVACVAEGPADSTGDGTAGSSGSSGDAGSATTVGECASEIAIAWCAEGPDIELCYGDAWQAEIADPVNWLAVGDIDGDGVSDAVAFNHTPPRINLFLGSKCGTPRALPTIALVDYVDVDVNDGVLLATVVDLDRDGRADVVGAFHGEPSSLVVFAGTDSGLDFRQRVDFAMGVTALRTGDVDGDGALDLVYPAMSFPRRAVVHFGSSGGMLGPPQSLQVLPYESADFEEDILIKYFEVFDFDEDGLADLNLGFRAEDLGEVRYGGQIMFGGGDGYFGEVRAYDILHGFSNRSLSGNGDFDGDGHRDLIVPGAVYLGDGGGGFKGTQPFHFGYEFEATPVVDDLDGDGLDDVMLYDRWHLGTADGLGPAIAVPAGELRGSGDFNGDGLPDLIEIVPIEDWSSNSLVIRFGAPS